MNNTLTIDTNKKYKAFNWKSKLKNFNSIGINSKSDKQKIINDIVYIEVNERIFNNELITKVEFNLLYILNNEVETKKLVFTKNDEFSLKSIHYIRDIDSKIMYLIKKYNPDTGFVLEDEKKLTDNYLYIKKL